MKVRIGLNQELFFTFFLIISSQFAAFSQVNDSTDVKRPGLYTGLSAGPSKTLIKNEGISSIPGIISEKMNSYSISAEIGYFFTKHIGLSSGIGYAPFKTEISLDTYQDKFNTIDSEKEAYERQTFGSNMKEVQKIDFLSIPVCLNLRLPFSSVIGFFIQTGVNFSIPVSTNYSSSGTFTYKGYYPAYNVLLQNLPAYGFPTNKSTADEGALDLKTVCVFGIVSAGLDFFVNEKFQILVAANYSKSFSDISASSSQNEFRLSSEVDQISSFMAGSSKVSAESMGINIGLKYYFK